MLALVIDGAVTVTTDTPPVLARRLDSGAWETPGTDGWTDEALASCGWLPVAVPTRPDDTDTHTTECVLSVVDGTPVASWAVRPWTPVEIAARAPVVDLAAVRASMAAATTILGLRAASLKLVDSFAPIVV